MDDFDRIGENQDEYQPVLKEVDFNALSVRVLLLIVFLHFFVHVHRFVLRRIQKQDVKRQPGAEANDPDACRNDSLVAHGQLYEVRPRLPSSDQVLRQLVVLRLLGRHLSCHQRVVALRDPFISFPALALALMIAI